MDKTRRLILLGWLFRKKSKKLYTDQAVFFNHLRRSWFTISFLIALTTASAMFFSGCSGNGSNTSPESPPVVAPTISWAPAVTGLPGAVVRDLAVDPTDFNRMFAATDDGLYRTSDGGLSWSAVKSGNIILSADVVVIDPLTPSTVYTGKSGTGVFKSTDRGATWIDANVGLTDNTVRVLTIDPASPGTIYAGTNTGILKSMDGAISWTALNLPISNTAINAIAVDTSNPGTIYAATYGAGVLRSIDGGVYWSILSTGLENLRVSKIAIDPADPSTIYVGTHGSTHTSRNVVFKSTDGGASWVSTGFQGDLISALAIDPLDTSTLYASNIHAGVSKSVDGGLSWSGSITDLSFSCFDIVIDQANPNRIYVGGAGDFLTGIVNGPARNGVFFSDDAGETWVPRNDGMTNVDVVALIVSPTDPSFVCAGTDYQYLGFHSSADGGVNWIGRTSPASAATILTFAIDPTDPAIIYAAGMGRSSHIFTVSGNELLYLCGFGCIGFKESFVNAIAAAPTGHSTILYLGTNKGVFKSMDLGVSWSNASFGLTDTNVNALVVDSKTPTTLYAGTQDGIFKSTNSGASWTPTRQGLTVATINALAIDPADSAILYCGTEGGLFRTLDAGTSWNLSNSGLGNNQIQALAVDPVQPAIVYAGTPGGVFRSINHGENWSGENDGLYVLDVKSIAIDSVTPSTIYVGTMGGGVFKTE